MEYNIRVYKPELKQEEGKINNLKGFATITFDEAFCVKSLAIKESSKGNLYLDMPRYRDYETGEYVPFFRFTDKEFQKEVLDTVNHKVKVVIHKEEAEWIRYENAFEPVINRHQYEVVGNLMKMDTMRGAKGLALLSGLVKCGDCKESMVLKSPDKVHHYYVCSTSLYEKQCSSHSISEKKLVGAVTEAILHYISVLVELKEILAYVKTASIPRQRLLEEDKKLEMLEKESQRILNIKVKLYDSFAEEILDRTEFETFKAKYDQSLEEIRQAMECQQREIRNLQETLEKQQEWLEYFLEYRDRTEVDRLMLVNLVKRIEVYEQKRIIIHFWFEDEFEKVLGLLETVNRAKPDQHVEAFLKGKGAEASA